MRRLTSYAEVVDRLGLTGVCLGQCGIDLRSHRNGFLFLGALHWAERRVTRRGLRRFLLLVSRRDRLEDSDYLNDPKFRWYYLWAEEQHANIMASVLGVRFPAAFSRKERLACLSAARRAGVRLATERPAIYAWAARGAA